MPSTRSLISILIRSMGRTSLSRALDSVAGQTWPHLEVLVINASGQPHPVLPEDFPFPLRLIDSSTPLRRSAAANQLLQEAQGELGLFLDDDDRIGPDHLTRLAQALRDNPGHVLAYADVSCVENNTAGMDHPPREVRRYAQPYDATRLMLENYIPIHAALFDLELVRTNPELRFDTRFDLFEDWDFWLQLQQQGSFLHVPGVSAWYHIHGNSGAGVRMAENDSGQTALLQLLDKWHDRWNSQQLSELIGLARHVYPLQDRLTEAQLKADKLERDNDNLRTSMQQLEKLHAEELSKLFSLHQHELETHQAQANQLQRENNLLKTSIAELEKSHSKEIEQRNAQQLKALNKLQSTADHLHRDNAILLHSIAELEKLHAQAQEQLTMHQNKLNSQKIDHQQALEAQQREHDLTLEQLRQHYESSRSWRVTRPLRAVTTHTRTLLQRLFPQYHKVSAHFFSALLQLTTRIYHWPLFTPISNRISPIVKRRIRNFLFYRSIAPNNQHRPNSGLLRPMGDETLVSIVIPVYNHARYLRQCLDSALQQSWKNLEVIAVNDASPDPQVREILDSYQGHPRLKLIHLPDNGGICHAQNQALIASSGQIIAFLDCDDYLHPDAITTSMQYWQDNTIYAHTGRINVDENGNEINRIHFVELPRQDYFQENLRAMYATHLKLIRRDAFVKVGLFDPRFDTAQDYEMLMRIAFHYPSSSFVHVPDFVYHHRLHQQQATEQQNDKQQRLTRQIQHEARLRQSIRNGEYKRFISFIMLSYGKHSQTLEAIKGLQQTVSIPHEIILYDNGSTAETVAFIRQHIDGQFDHVRVFYGDQNLGPAQGRRKALEYATGEWFIIFDNDEIPEPGWLEELLLRAEANDNVGAVSCRVVFPDGKLQFSGGYAETGDNQRVELKLYDMGEQYTNLGSCVFRELDWCPIGATLFTENIAPYLHSGYPNVFEDAGVSFALKKKGLKLLNAPGALVWHEHVTYRADVEMSQEYMQARYNPQKMLISVASFYRENGLIIHDEYVWRENQLYALEQPELIKRLEQAPATP